MLRLTLLCALAAVCACGPLGDSGASKAAEKQPSAAQPEQPAAATPDPADPLAGLWWVLLPKFPVRAFRVTLEPGSDAPLRSGSWESFDWRRSTDPETLQRRSKPVRIEARLDGPRLVLEGPAPMLTESGQPNGQSGRWRVELHRSELPGEPPRWSGTAVHDGGLTGPEGVRADLERGFRRWQ